MMDLRLKNYMVSGRLPIPMTYPCMTCTENRVGNNELQCERCKKEDQKHVRKLNDELYKKNKPIITAMRKG